MLLGIVLAIIAGALVSLQTIFNNKVNERTGSWATTTLVLGTGFLASLLGSLILKGKIHLLYSICSRGTGSVA